MSERKHQEAVSLAVGFFPSWDARFAALVELLEAAESEDEEAEILGVVDSLTAAGDDPAQQARSLQTQIDDLERLARFSPVHPRLGSWLETLRRAAERAAAAG